MRSVMTKETIAFSKNPKKTPISLLIASLPNKLTYKKGGTLDLSGLAMVVRYSDDTVKDITGDIITEPVEGSTLSISGRVDLLISYSENDITVTTSLPITVETKIVTWSEGTDEEIAAMVDAADKGLIDLTQYWSVGNERNITLSAMEAGNTGRSHVSQTITFVLMNKGGKELVTPTASGQTECNFIVGQKQILAESGVMDRNYAGWTTCARRKWLNSIYRNAIPEALRPIFKQHKNYFYDSGNTNKNVETQDYFAIPSNIEVFGGNNATEKQFEYFQTPANRELKNPNYENNWTDYWTRTCYRSSYGSSYSYYFYYASTITVDGSNGNKTWHDIQIEGSQNPYYSNGIVAFGVI